MRGNKLVVILCAAIFAVTPFIVSADANSKELGAIHVTGNYHMEANDFDYADGFDVLAGFDFLLWKEADLYAGPRLGWYSETVPTGQGGMHQKPSLGGQIYFLYPAPFLRQLAGVAGFACDFLFNIDGTFPDQPVYFFASAFLGLRYTFGRIHLEGRLEAGLFPFFDSDSLPYFLKFGLQVGYHI
jgi:hypothetical protein